MASVNFMLHAQKFWPDKVAWNQPTFDCRVFSLPDQEELANAFLWRERDATKNAVSMATRAYYSASQMQGKTSSDMHEMLHQKGINFNDYPSFFKRGVFVRKEVVERYLTDEELENIPEKHRPDGPVMRNRMVEIDMPPFGSVTNRAGVIAGGENYTTSSG
jgi:tRNA(His) 5'-end guanylyltransferase